MRGFYVGRDYHYGTHIRRGPHDPVTVFNFICFQFHDSVSFFSSVFFNSSMSSSAYFTASNAAYAHSRLLRPDRIAISNSAASFSRSSISVPIRGSGGIPNPTIVLSHKFSIPQSPFRVISHKKSYPTGFEPVLTSSRGRATINTMEDRHLRDSFLKTSYIGFSFDRVPQSKSVSVCGDDLDRWCVSVFCAGSIHLKTALYNAGDGIRTRT